MARLWFNIKWFFQGPLCKLGHHNGYTADVLEGDASVSRGFCLHCCADTAPLRPRPANPEEAAENAALQRALDEYLKNEKGTSQ
jgi:hypothetical protein